MAIKNSQNDIRFTFLSLLFFPGRIQDKCAYVVRRFLPSFVLAVYWAVLSSLCSFGAESQPESFTIAIVQPGNVAAYQEAIQGFLQMFKRNFTSHFNTIIYESPDDLYKTLAQNQKKLRQTDIDLIVTVGTYATQEVSRKVKDIPIVFSMVLNPENILEHRENIVGVSLNIPLEYQMKMITEVLPHVKTIGIIYDKRRNAKTAKDIAKYARQFNLGMKAFAVTSQKEIPTALSKVSEDTDVLLGIVDHTVYTSQTAKYIINYSVKKHFPFIGISQSYVKAGALCSLVFDNQDIGGQTAQLARHLLSGTSASELQIVTPRKIDIAINRRTARIIGVDIPKEVLEKAAIVYE